MISGASLKMRSVGRRRAAGRIQISSVDRDTCCLVCSCAEIASEPGARSTFDVESIPNPGAHAWRDTFQVRTFKI